MSYLILKCGSQARGDTNPNSDHDFVCIHDEHHITTKQTKERYPQISFLSVNVVDRMKNKGALFLTHLDIDGCVVEGEEKLLEKIRGYRPNTESLRKSIAETKTFIAAVKWLPDSSEGRLWFHDVMFVALRNVLYCENAARSMYLFGYVDAALAFGLNSSEVDIMLQIRNGKYSYRSSSGFDGCGLDKSLNDIFNLVRKIVGQDLFFRIGGKTDWWEKWNYSYWDERIVERAIVNNEIADDGFRGLLKDHNYHRRALVDVLKNRINYAQQAPPADALKARAAEA